MTQTFNTEMKKLNFTSFKVNEALSAAALFIMLFKQSGGCLD